MGKSKSYILVETISLEMDKCKSKNETSVSEVVEALKGIFDLPYLTYQIVNIYLLFMFKI